jgi:hypothetical protein
VIEHSQLKLNPINARMLIIVKLTLKTLFDNPYATVQSEIKSSR